MEEDYSNVKAPSQIGLPTFWNSVEPYLREIREDDLAMLGFKVCAMCLDSFCRDLAAVQRSSRVVGLMFRQPL